MCTRIKINKKFTSCISLALLFLNSFWDLIDGGNNWSSCQLTRPQMYFVTRNEGLYLFKYNNFSRNEQYNVHVFAFWLNFMSDFSYRLFIAFNYFTEKCICLKFLQTSILIQEESAATNVNVEIWQTSIRHLRP